MAFGIKENWQDFDEYFSNKNNDNNDFPFYDWEDSELHITKQPKQKSKTVTIVGYKINESYHLPFLSFLLITNSGEFEFPHFTYTPTSTDNMKKQKANQKYLIELFLSRIVEYLFVPTNPRTFMNPPLLQNKKIFISDVEVSNCNMFVFVDFTPLHIKTVTLSRKTSPYWFCLPDEIMNLKHVCNIKVNTKVTHFFLHHPSLLFLYKNQKKDKEKEKEKEKEKTEAEAEAEKEKIEKEADADAEEDDEIPLETPQVLYAGSHEKNVFFQHMFGKLLQTNPRFGRVFSFTDFKHAIRDGGWSSNYEPEYKYRKLITDEKTAGKYKKGGILRFAVFLGNSLFLAPEDSEEYLDSFVSCLEIWKPELETAAAAAEPTETNLCYSSIMQVPNVWLKDYKLQIALTYHFIDKDSLGDVFDKTNEQYRIR